MDIIKAAKQIIDKNLLDECDDPFYILNLDDVKVKYEYWIKKIPRVTPYYAVKCNDDEKVLKLLKKLGTGFDCASKTEILKILTLNIEQTRIIYAHTVKQVSHLKFAAENKVEKVTFDTPDELMKIKKFHPNAKLILRIRFDASNSIVKLGEKFGCNPNTDAPNLIKMCKELKMNLVGISFHVGSGTTDYPVYENALRAIRTLFDYAETLNIKLNIVDIGGGFIGNDLSIFDNYANAINYALEKYFPSKEIEIISEPGRYFVDSAVSIVTQIILKRLTEDGKMYYFLNDSVHMMFLSCILFHHRPNFSIIRKTNSVCELKEFMSSIWGCTCNSVDKIIGDIDMPELDIGDFLLFHNMGAYSVTMSTQFNGFSVGNFHYIENYEIQTELSNC